MLKYCLFLLISMIVGGSSLTSNSAHAATLLGSPTSATGILNLNVDGTAYDVRFVFETYNQAYANSAPIFVNNPSLAADASVSLTAALNVFGVTKFADSFQTFAAVIPDTFPLSGYVLAQHSIYNYSIPNAWAYFGDEPIVVDGTYGHNEMAIFSAATPLPAALPLFATGLGVLGLLGWRRKRVVAA